MKNKTSKNMTKHEKPWKTITTRKNMRNKTWKNKTV
jgi:hypothetical protein